MSVDVNTMLKPPRYIYLVFMLIPIIFMGINHYAAENNGTIYPALIVLGPFLIALFLAGIVDPFAPMAINPKTRKALSLRTKIIGWTAASIGTAGGVLLLGYYAL